MSIEKPYEKKGNTMTLNGDSLSILQPAIPFFKGESYEFYIIKMKTTFKSQGLSDLAEERFVDPDEETQLKDNRKKDSKTLFFIQQAVYTFLSRITTATTSKQTWTSLQTQFKVH